MTTAAPPPMTDERCVALEHVLAEMVVAHERLGELAVEHRAAIRSMRPEAIREVVTRTGEALRHVAALDDERRTLLGVRDTPGSSGATPTVREVAALMREPFRSRVLELGERLRGLIALVAERHAALRRASESLLAHMQGIMHLVSAELSGTGTYTPRGRVYAGHPIVTGLDLRS